MKTNILVLLILLTCLVSCAKKGSNEIRKTIDKVDKVTASYSISYFGNGADSGSVPKDFLSPYVGGSFASVLGIGDLSKSNHSFSGWNTKNDGTGNMYSEGDRFSLSRDIKLYAIWATEKYDLIYHGNSSDSGSAPIDELSPYAHGSDVTVIGNTGSLAKNNYRFISWNSQANGLGVSYDTGDSLIIKEDTSLYAQWSREFSILYNGNGENSGEVVETNRFIQGESGIVKPKGALDRAGYRFIEWSTASDGSGHTYSAGDSYTFSTLNDLVLYAVWAKESSIIYHKNGGDGGSVEDSNLYILGESGVIKGKGDLTRSGFRFIEWNTAFDGTGNTFNDGDNYSFNSAVNLNLYAIWGEEFSVSYNGNGEDRGSVVDEALYLQGESLTVLGKGGLQKEDSKFQEWNTVPDGSGTSYEEGDTINVSSDISLYAIWTPMQWLGSSLYESHTDDSAARQSVALSNDGSSMAIYRYGNRIYAVASDATGTIESTTVIDNGTGVPNYPFIAGGGDNGSYIVVWSELLSGVGYKLHWNIYENDSWAGENDDSSINLDMGTTSTPFKYKSNTKGEVIISVNLSSAPSRVYFFSPTSGLSTHHELTGYENGAVALNDNGDAVVAWRDTILKVDRYLKEVGWQTTETPGIAGYNPYPYPNAVALAGNGDVFIGLISNEPSSTNKNVGVLRYKNTNSSWLGVEAISNKDRSNIQNIHLAAGESDALASWYTNNLYIFINNFVGETETWGAKGETIGSALNWSITPYQVFYDSKNTAYVLYMSEGDTAYMREVFLAKFSNSSWFAPVKLSHEDNTESLQQAFVAFNSSGELTVVYLARDGSNEYSPYINHYR